MCDASCTRMLTTPHYHNEILRAAIAWALSIADAAEETLVAAVLAEALFYAENPVGSLEPAAKLAERLPESLDRA